MAGEAHIVAVGLNHRTAPVEVRERLAFDEANVRVQLDRLRSDGVCDEALLVSTCNRVELYAVSTADPADRLRAWLSGFTQGKPVDTYLAWWRDREAISHLFQVAGSLDSMVLGEPQILGQVKDAYDAAVAAGALRSHLSRCVHRAFTVAKRVRTETQLGAGIVSISSVAVDLTKHIFGDLGSSTVLLVGAGEMAEQAAKSLGKGAKSIRVCNRSFDRAATLAATFGGTAAPLDQLEAELVISDVVVASTSSKTFVITKDLVKRVMKQRKGKTLFLIDIAVPRNIDPEVHKLDNVYVYNIDDLEAEVAENMKLRQKEVTAAEVIVDAELAEWAAWARGLNVNPTVVALRARTRGVLVAELERSLGQRLKHLTEGDRAALLQMMESATNKLLHAPTTRLKAAASSSDAGDLVEALHHLFDLPKAPESAEEGVRDSRTMRTDGSSQAPIAAEASEKRLPH